MQKLTYINLLNERAVFADAPPTVFCKIAGIGSTDIDTETLRGAYQQGVSLIGYRRAQRDVSVTLHLQGGNRAALYEQRQTLLGILSPDRALDGENRAKIIYENDHGRWWTWAFPSGGVDMASGRVANTLPSVRVDFACECPYWFAMAQSECRFSYSGEGFTLPFSFPISFGRRDFSRVARNDGQVAAPVEVWIYGRGEAPKLVNQSTEERLELIDSLPTGSVLYINTDPARLAATITDANGASSSAFGLLSVQHPLTRFVLRAGANHLRYETGGTSARSEIVVKWYARYEGV